MSEPTDAPPGAAHPDTAPPLPEQTFFADLRSIGCWASRWRSRPRSTSCAAACRRSSGRSGGLASTQAPVAPGIVDAEAQRRDAAAFVAHLLESVLGEQQAKRTIVTPPADDAARADAPGAWDEHDAAAHQRFVAAARGFWSTRLFEALRRQVDARCADPRPPRRPRAMPRRCLRPATSDASLFRAGSNATCSG